MNDVPPADASPSDDSVPGWSDSLAESAARLRRELEQLERARDLSTSNQLAALHDLESREMDLLASVEDDDAETLSVGAVLARLQHWEDLCQRASLNTEADRCGQLAEQVGSEAAHRWESHCTAILDESDPDTLFRKLLESSQLLSDALTRDGISEDSLTGVVDAQQAIQSAIASRCTDTPPETETLGEWSRLLSDHLVTVLTTLDDLPPDLAASQLEDAINLARWYLADIDSKRSHRSRRIRNKLRRLRAELQERRLNARLERKFGRRFIAITERLVFVLICFVLVLMTLEWTLPLSQHTLRWFGYLDAAACAVFLTEFCVKLALAQGRGRWFCRHMFVDLIPSIPVGLLTSGLAGSGDLIRAGRVLRYARLPRLVRYVRILRPVIRFIRALGLMARGLDRLVRRYSHILNVNVILHPTQAEYAKAVRRRAQGSLEIRSLDRHLLDAWSTLLLEADETEQRNIASHRLRVLEDAVREHELSFEESIHRRTVSRDLPAELLLDQMEALDPALVEPLLGEAMTIQFARVIRSMSAAPLRWFPIIRSCVPRDTAGQSDATVVAEASHRSAAFFRRFHDLWFWVSDLYGTVTPSQFIDRLGGLLVKSSFRPAQRLILFGGFLLLVEGTLRLLSLAYGEAAQNAAETVSDPTVLEHIRDFLKRFVGTTLLVLGSVCFFILALGWWMQRVAREATEFYEKSVLAQFLLLTETIRSRRLERDAEQLYYRALRPDWDTAHDDPGAGVSAERSPAEAQRVGYLEKRLRSSMLRCETPPAEADGFPFLDRLVMLYRDWLDGAMFTSGDTRTTNQLLGNTALRQLLLTSERISRRNMKAFQQVDLENQKSLLKGPYLWFHFIANSLSHSVAALIVDYNRKAIPLHELDLCSPEVQQTYATWLGTATTGEEIVEIPSDAEAHYVTTAFTALHFLDPDPEREREIEERFGPMILQRMKRDRSLLIRRTFGTLPMHLRPRSERVINLFALYENWISGGRIFLLPVFLLGTAAQGLGRLFVWLWGAVQELRQPERRTVHIDAAQADFRVAVRKITRIRGPVAAHFSRLRAMFDPAWLGIPLPGETSTRLQGANARVDLQILQLGPKLERVIETEREHAQENMRLFETILADGLLNRIAVARALPPESLSTRTHLRAAGIAIHGDLRGVRRHLLGPAILQHVFQTTDAVPTFRDRLTPKYRLRKAFNAWWKRHGADFERDDPGHTNGSETASASAHRRAARAAAWKAALRNEDGVADVLFAWARHGDNLVAEGERRLGDLLVHPDRLTEQLLTLRTLHTLSILDILHYREQVFEIGDYPAEQRDEYFA
ncbi:MAG: ion transporter [Planctomycetota bacterium]|jgi:hypothetical protein